MRLPACHIFLVAYAFPMHIHNTAPFRHDHAYVSGHEHEHERRTWIVVGITAAMMAAEIVCGLAFHSMALLADGWHMSTHAGALGIAGFAYLFARRQARNPRFTFGTGKVGALGGYTSAVILAVIAFMVAAESFERLLHPVAIVFNEAIFVATLGLCVNLLSAWLLRDDHHDHEHHHHDHEEQGHAHAHDPNLRAAYMHVLADAFTSLLAIGALTLGKYRGWVWLDPLVGIVGSLVIASWASGLLRQSSALLLDNAPAGALAGAVREALEADADNQVTDLHLWHVAPGKLSAIVSLVTDDPRPPRHYKALLEGFGQIVHVTVEVNRCE
jgi:cation diffusion facilitator family transporter